MQKISAWIGQDLMEEIYLDLFQIGLIDLRRQKNDSRAIEIRFSEAVEKPFLS